MMSSATLELSKQPEYENNKEEDEEEQDGDEEWDDLLGTNTVLKQVLVRGKRWQEDANDPDDDGINMEAPRKFFALIDISTRLHGDLGVKPIDSESHENFLINSDADLFAGVHLVIPLMDVHETSRYIFDPKFAYGQLGNLPHVPANAKLDCIITLKMRSSYEEFLERLRPSERLLVANRKKERGKFWYSREDYPNAIAIYQSLTDLCELEVNVDGDDGVDKDKG